MCFLLNVADVRTVICNNRVALLLKNGLLSTSNMKDKNLLNEWKMIFFSDQCKPYFGQKKTQLFFSGNFSFGSFTKFKSTTIVDFIENAVEHSRSGRYLFFLHRRPVLGPMRVQLLHPVSRFKRVQSLQHLCR